MLHGYVCFLRAYDPADYLSYRDISVNSPGSQNFNKTIKMDSFHKGINLHVSEGIFAGLIILCAGKVLIDHQLLCLEWPLTKKSVKYFGGCAIIGTIAIACDCCFTIKIIRLIGCYIFKSKLNISMISL